MEEFKICTIHEAEFRNDGARLNEMERGQNFTILLSA